MLAKVEGPFLPSVLAREEVHRILSRGGLDFWSGEASHILAYLDRLTPGDIAEHQTAARRGLWQRFLSIIRT